MKKIPLTKGQVALVDDSDYDFLNQWKWYAHKDGGTYYATRGVVENGKVKTVMMHTLLLDVKAGMETDHRDGNGLNNGRQNLRVCTKAQNQHNRKKQNGTTSRFKGVYWSKRGESWLARIRVNKKLICLGYFSTESGAALAYNDAAIKHFGQFARINTVEGSDASKPRRI